MCIFVSRGFHRANNCGVLYIVSRDGRMDTELFMECEEEELEPWQQVDDDVEEDEVQFINSYGYPVEQSPSPPASCATPLPPVAVPFVSSQPMSATPQQQASTSSGSVKITAVQAPSLPPQPVVAPVASLPSASTTTASRPSAPVVSSVTSTCPLVPAAVPQGQPLILTQTPSGAFLLPAAAGQPNSQQFFLTTQGFPVQNVRSVQNVVNPMAQLVFNLKPGQTVQPLTLIQSPQVSQIVRPQVLPQAQAIQVRAPTPAPSLGQPSSSYTTLQIPTKLTLRPSHPVSAAPVIASQGTPLKILDLKLAGFTNRLPVAVSSSPVTVVAKAAATFQAPLSSPTKRCPKCGAEFKMQAALSGHMCFCCPDLVTESPSQAAPAESHSVQMANTKVVLTVEDFYYGSYDGSRNLRGPEDTLAKPIFKCQVCSHQAEDNLRMMQHMHQHSDLGAPPDPEDDGTLCRHCFRQFSSPKQLRTHQEQVHGSVGSSCMCRICEWAFESEPVFLNHMKSNHKPGEMPYVCQVCAYRSSFYVDVYNHFMTWHRDTRFLLCVFCLKVTRNLANYQQHLMRHQKNQAFHCNKCRLQFVFLKDKLVHKTQHHKTFRKPAQLEGLPAGAKVTIRTSGKAKYQQGSGNSLMPLQGVMPGYAKPLNVLKETQTSPLQKRPLLPKSFKSGIKKAGSKKGSLPSKVQRKSDACVEEMCMECGMEASDIASHYPTHVHCLLCSYGTCCSRAYAAHMIHHHVPRAKDKPLPLHLQAPPCYLKLQCSGCDYVPLTGDMMADHLARNPDHSSSQCQTRRYVEPDIEFGQTDEEKEAKDENFLEQSCKSVTEWEEPMQNDTEGHTFTAGEFTEDSGPFYSLSKNTDAIDYFHLLFPASLIELITNETNAHAKTCQHLGLFPDWNPVTTYEIKGYIGLVILMGIQNLPDLSHYWSWSHNDNGYTFYRAMSFNRFKQISMNLRMGSFTTDQYRHSSNDSDPLHIFRPMLDILGKAMWEAYRPNCCLTIDRALLPSLEDEGVQVKGTPKAQPQVWLLCDSKSGYCHRFCIDTGSKSGEEQGFGVVPELVKGLESKHHQLFLASSLTSVPLLQKLLDQGIYASSSFPLLSPILPKQLWEQGQLQKAGDFLQRRCGPLLATRWKDAKEMGCLSTNAAPGQPDTVWRRSQTKAGELDPIQRPMAFRLLQENMRGVDICKQLLACNPLGGLPQDRHWRNIFWFLVNLSVVNAFIVLRESRKDNPPFWVQDGLFSQSNFRKRLGNQLAKCAQKYVETMEVAVSRGTRQDVDEAPVKQRHRMVKVSAISKRCRNCNKKNIRHESVYGCIICKVNLCKRPSCFWEFHGLSPLNRVSTKIGFVKDRLSGTIETDEDSEPFVCDQGHADDAMAPVEEMDTSEDEPMEDLDEMMAEETTQGQEANSSLKGESLERPAASSAVKDREDSLSARQLRISLFALCGGIRQASRDFSTEPQLIQAWLKEARHHLRGRHNQDGKAGGVERMVEWALAMREQQIAINESNLFQKATFFKKKGAFSDCFRISYDWAVSFMLQHHLGMQTPGRVATVGRVLPQSMEDKAQCFVEFTQRQIQAHKFPDSSIAAMDELSIFVDFDLIADKSKVDSRVEALKLCGSVPPLLTIYLAALADGTMLPTLVLLKGPPVDMVLPDTVLLEASQEGFTLEHGLELWTIKVWQRHVSAQKQSRKSIVILDRHREHTSDPFLAATSSSGTLAAVIPPGCAFRLQPLDICVRPMLQNFLLTRWAKFTDALPRERLQTSVAKLLIDWTAEALTCFADRPQVLRKSYLLTGLLPAKRTEEESLSPTEVQSQLLNTLGEALMGAKALEPCAADELELEDEQEAEEAGDTDKKKGNQADQAKAQADQATAGADQATARADQATVKTDQATAKTDQATAKTNQATAQTDQATAQADQATAQADQATAQADQATAQAADQATAQADQATAQADQATAQADQATAQADQATEEMAVEGKDEMEIESKEEMAKGDKAEMEECGKVIAKQQTEKKEVSKYVGTIKECKSTCLEKAADEYNTTDVGKADNVREEMDVCKTNQDRDE